MDDIERDEIGRNGVERPSGVSRVAVGVVTVVAVLVFGGGVAAGFLGSTETSRAGSIKVSVAWGPNSAMISATGPVESVVTVADGNPVRFDGLGVSCVEVVGAVTTLWVTNEDGDGTRLDRPGDAALAEDAAVVPSVEPCSPVAG